MNKLYSLLFKDYEKGRNYGLLIFRVGLAVLMLFNHGWDKLIAGPEKWTSIAEFGLQHLGINYFLTFFGFMAAFSESFGAVLIGIGFLFRTATVLLLFTMLIAANMHLVTGQGDPEMALLYALVSLALTLIGPGKISLDRLFLSKST